jgi:hypothetical protein
MHVLSSPFFSPPASSLLAQVDDQKIIFFEGLTIDYWPNGFSNGPGFEINFFYQILYHED